MRLVRFLVLFVLVAMVGWLVVRSVSVVSTDDKLQITIDKRKLKQAGRDLEVQGREAAGKVGHSLQEAGKRLEQQKPAAE
jgi:hypothetical protein